MKHFATLLVIALLTGVVLAPIGCGSGGIPTSKKLNWLALMSCSSTPQSTKGDLVWTQFTFTGAIADIRPGDRVSLTLGLRNTAAVAAGDDANISLPSNLRIFLSFDQQLDQNDYLTGEFVVPGLPVNRSQFIVDQITIPRPTAPPTVVGQEDNYFPIVMPDPNAAKDPNYDPYNPARPEYIGPISINYFVIGVLDSQNCIHEADGAEPNTREDQRGVLNPGINAGPALNNQFLFGPITVNNPNLPNLTISFIDVQPIRIPEGESIAVTTWEVLNSGIGPVNAADQYGVRVYWSENDTFDNWDRNVVTGATIAAGPDGVIHNPDVNPANRASSNDDVLMFQGPLFGNTNATITAECRWPYSVFRANSYSNFNSSRQIWNLIDEIMTRNPPPAGPPGYDFLVYNPVPTNNQAPNYLLGQVDGTDTIRESVEFDNYSTQVGELEVFLSVNAGPFDIAPTELTHRQQQQQNNQLDMQLRYDSTLPAADNCSIGWYFSPDNKAQSTDYYCERFWYQILGNAQGTVLNTVWTPNNIPQPGDFFIMAVMDDIFKFIGREPKDNNFVVSTNTKLLF